MPASERVPCAGSKPLLATPLSPCAKGGGGLFPARKPDQNTVIYFTLLATLLYLVHLINIQNHLIFSSPLHFLIPENLKFIFIKIFSLPFVVHTVWLFYF